MPPEPPTMPFGVHRGKPLPDVPEAYLLWAVRECRLSAPLRLAVGNELRRRGREAPPAPPRRIPACRACGPAAKVTYLWSEDRAGRKYIRSECRACGRWLGAAPLTEPFTTLADAAASKAPVLDALIGADDAGVQLVSDGAAVHFAANGWHNAPPELRRAVRQCNHTLAKMLPRETPRCPTGPSTA